MNTQTGTSTSSTSTHKTFPKKAQKGAKPAADAQPELPTTPAKKPGKKGAAAASEPVDTDQALWLAIDNKPAVAFLVGQGGAYWSTDGKVGIFLVNGQKEGGQGEFEWDGKPAVALSAWGKLCADLLYRQADKPLAELVRAALDRKTGGKEAVMITELIVEEQAQAEGKFSPAEAVGREMANAGQPASGAPVEPVMAETKADDKTEAAAVERPVAKLSDPELKIELEARGVTKIGDLRDLGAKLGFGFSVAKAAKPAAAAGEKRPGLWAFTLGLMRRDSGVTEAEALKLLGEEFPKHDAGSTKSTITTNLSALRMLVGGRGAGAGEYTLNVSTDEKRGRIYKLVGATLHKDAKGILNEAAKALMQEGGASEAEIVEKLTAMFPDRPKASLKSTVQTQLSMWRSILPEGASEATFSIAAGDGGKSVYRVR